MIRAPFVAALHRLRGGPGALGPALVLATVAWLWMVLSAVRGHRFACCGAFPAWREEAAGWAAMVAAMMVPTTLGAQRDVARRSYRARRVRAVFAYLLGYTSPWILLGARLRAACS